MPETETKEEEWESPEGYFIDGCAVTHQVMKSKRSKGCGDCGFTDWSPGDSKFIVEGRGSRDHLCPACGVLRGLPVRCYVRNENAPPFRPPKRQKLEAPPPFEEIQKFLREFQNSKKLADILEAMWTDNNSDKDWRIALAEKIYEVKESRDQEPPFGESDEELCPLHQKKYM
jgi:hypothetical protein